jgi:hypothetical protein
MAADNHHNLLRSNEPARQPCRIHQSESRQSIEFYRIALPLYTQSFADQHDYIDAIIASNSAI